MSLEWVKTSDRLPDIEAGERASDEVLGGCWIEDEWLRAGHPKKHRFIFGSCFLMRTDDLRSFPDGKQWHTFGPSHSAITHWAKLNPPNA